MTVASLAGSIDVNLMVQAGRVVRVDIVSARSFAFGRLAAGRSLDSVVVLIRRLFSLCAAAQSAAAASAMEAARGETIDAAAMRARTGAVLAERVVELLRGTVTALAGTAIAAFAPDMRRIAAAARALDDRAADAETARAAIDEIERALTALGLGPHDLTDKKAFDRWIGSGLPFAALLRPIAESAETDFGAIVLDPLSSGADLAIGGRLLGEGAGFAARPSLDRRVPETGALVRNIDHPLVAALAQSHGAGLLVRLVARAVEASATPARLRATLFAGEEAAEADVMRCYAMGSGRGLAAVECARGRLHHLAEVADDRKVGRLEILAPTEWNFHPLGPLARALSGAVVGTDRAARTRIDRLIAAFDPCVAFRANLVEAAHA